MIFKLNTSCSVFPVMGEVVIIMVSVTRAINTNIFCMTIAAAITKACNNNAISPYKRSDGF